MPKYVTETQEWLKADGQFGWLGVTEFAAKELGEIILVDLPAVGAQFQKGQSVAVLESTKVAAEVYAPVDLEIVEVNEALKNQPSIINKSPENDGWIVKIKVLNQDQLKELKTVNQLEA
jgi:glycine cleavage system H protein